jgi:hypothetical protein
MPRRNDGGSIWFGALFGLGLVLAAASRPGIVALPMQLPFAVAMPTDDRNLGSSHRRAVGQKWVYSSAVGQPWVNYFETC